METKNNSRKFLSGFGNTDIIEDIYVGDIHKLRPGTIISENDFQYKIELGIPFMNKEDFKLAIEQYKLIIDVEKKINNSETRKQRKYKGIFQLPADVLIRDLEVKFDQGLLTVLLPKQRIVKQFQNSRNA